MPAHSLFIASYPARDGGVGHRDPVTNAIASFVIPLSRSIHYAQHGIMLGHDHVLTMPPCYSRPLTNWKAEPIRLYQIFRLYPQQANLYDRFHCYPSNAKLATQSLLQAQIERTCSPHPHLPSPHTSGTTPNPHQTHKLSFS
jgi:hypothetical protein